MGRAGGTCREVGAPPHRTSVLTEVCEAWAPEYDLIDVAEVPGGGLLHLVRAGQDFEILLDGEQLMGSWCSRSEEALATLACAEAGPGARDVLIGGLGMGFTLAAALAVLPASARVTMAELVPGIVGWAEGVLSHLHGPSLADPRVTLEMRDVHDLIAEGGGRFDVILLDVDNGPDGLVTLANERLYSPWGLRAAWGALRPGGVLAVWSAYPDTAFACLLRTSGFDVRQVEVPWEEGRQPHILWLGTRHDPGVQSGSEGTADV